MSNIELKKADPISDARIAMVEFSQKHFKDKTFKSYILEALAGDFCWEVMRAIRAILTPQDKQAPARWLRIVKLNGQTVNETVEHTQAPVEGMESLRKYYEVEELPLYTTSPDAEALRKEIASLKNDLENERMRLAVCTAAATGNTKEAVRERLPKDHPYYSASYSDVCSAVDREIALRQLLLEASLALTSYHAKISSLRTTEAQHYLVSRIENILDPHSDSTTCKCKRLGDFKAGEHHALCDKDGAA